MGRTSSCVVVQVGGGTTPGSAAAAALAALGGEGTCHCVAEEAPLPELDGIALVVGGAAATRLEAELVERVEGFGEAVRAVIREARGVAEAVWTRAAMGRIGGRRVVLLPEDATAVGLAVERVLLPALGAAEDPRTGTATPTAPPEKPAPIASPPTPRGVEVVAIGSGSAPVEEPAIGWRRAVADMGGEVTAVAAPLPSGAEKLAPLVNVVETAGGRGELLLPGGRRYALFGWPSLRSDVARVLAIGDGYPYVEVLALHRLGARAGLCVENGSGWVPARNAPIVPICEELTGRKPPIPLGKLFAVDGPRVYIERDGRVNAWDGRRDTPQGSMVQALATLVLHWSNR